MKFWVIDPRNWESGPTVVEGEVTTFKQQSVLRVKISEGHYHQYRKPYWHRTRLSALLQCRDMKHTVIAKAIAEVNRLRSIDFK